MAAAKQGRPGAAGEQHGLGADGAFLGQTALTAPAVVSRPRAAQL
jgi:hypothetical protein